MNTHPPLLSSAFVSLLLLVGLTFATATNVNAQAKQDCQYFDNKLKTIRSKLRHGYTAKQGEKLKYQEKQIRRIWWLCVNDKMTDKQRQQWRGKIAQMTKS